MRLDAGLVVVLVVVSTACDDGSVRFGQPGGLRIRGVAQSAGACPLPPGVPEAPAPADCPSWTTDIFPLFDAQPTTPVGPGVYQCALTGCHNGPNDPTGVNMVAGQPGPSYDALVAFKNGDRPYLSPITADNPYLLCNIDPLQLTALGSPMPRGTVTTDDDFVLIGTWAACGMIDDSAGVGVGGAGGAGGAAGAGGI